MNPSQLLPRLRPGASILFIRLRSLGDILLSTPLYAAVKAWRPDLRLSVLVEEPYQDVLLRNPDLSRVFSLPSSARTTLSLLAARMATLRKLRLENLDCCINLHGGSTSGLFTWLSRAPYRVGLGNFRHPFCYNVRIELGSKGSHESKRHTVEHQMQWLHALGMPEAAISPLRVFPDRTIESRIEAKLRQQGIDPTASYCVIQPTSKFYTKEWTPRGFAEIADYIGAQCGYRTVLTGGPGEIQKLKLVADSCQTPPAILDEISISELMWVIKWAKLFVGNDSGPTHLAAALNVPIIVLFGSSDSQVWYPWKVAHQVVQNPFECNPCPGYRCLVYEEPKCILSITVSQVKQAIERLLCAGGP